MGHERIPGVGSFQHCADGHAVGERGGHILQAMHRHVNLAGFQATLDFFDEYAQSHAGQWRGAVGVALGGYGHDLKGQAGVGLPQGGQREVGLNQSQPAGAGADPHDGPGIVSGGHDGCHLGGRRRTYAGRPGRWLRCRRPATLPSVDAAVF